MTVRQENRNRRRLQYFNDRRNAMQLQAEATAQVREPRQPVEQPKSTPYDTPRMVRGWMSRHADEYDTATALVEAANAALNLPSWALDDPDHWVWEEAARFVP